jgi:hypothetical protein
MTLLDTARETRTSRLAVPIGILTAALVFLALVLPDRTVGAGVDGMVMTHYMGLLSVNQPWNLLLFMAIPVILAETLAITELAILFNPDANLLVRGLSRWAGLLAGPLMIAITVHLVRNAVLPLTTSAGWRGPADVVAVLAYLAGAIPLVGITLIELGLFGRTPREARKWHATFVGAFLVVAHIAMIFGMLNPEVLGWSQVPANQMPGGSTMPGMNH